MRIRWVGYGVRGFLKEAERGLYWDMICPNAEQRFKVLRFWERHGLLATQEAFGVARPARPARTGCASVAGPRR